MGRLISNKSFDFGADLDMNRSQEIQYLMGLLPWRWERGSVRILLNQLPWLRFAISECFQLYMIHVAEDRKQPASAFSLNVAEQILSESQL